MASGKTDGRTKRIVRVNVGAFATIRHEWTIRDGSVRRGDQGWELEHGRR